VNPAQIARANKLSFNLFIIMGSIKFIHNNGEYTIYS